MKFLDTTKLLGNENVATDLSRANLQMSFLSNTELYVLTGDIFIKFTF